MYGGVVALGDQAVVGLAVELDDFGGFGVETCVDGEGCEQSYRYGESLSVDHFVCVCVTTGEAAAAAEYQSMRIREEQRKIYLKQRTEFPISNLTLASCQDLEATVVTSKSGVTLERLQGQLQP